MTTAELEALHKLDRDLEASRIAVLVDASSPHMADGSIPRMTEAIKRLTGELEALRRDFRTLVTTSAEHAAALKTERDALAARVERLTQLRWDGHTLMVGAIQFGSIWNGTGQYPTPGWRAILSNCDHVGVYPTETEARAALETAAREACK